GDLDLHHRLEPVDVRALEQSDLDESHGRPRIAPRSRVRPSMSHGIRAPRLDEMDTMAAPGAGVRDEELDALRAAIRATEPAYLADLERLVNIDCGSYTPAGVDEVGRFVAGFLADLEATVEVRPDPTGRLGATVIGTLSGPASPGARLLLIGHMDTVFDPGTVAERPFAIAEGLATGPGVTDMKSG